MPTEPSAGPPSLRVATFNIRTGRAPDGANAWPRRRRRTLEVTVELDADVMGLQEVLAGQRRWLARRLPDWEPWGSGRGRFGGGEQCPLVVRRSVATVLSHDTRWFGPDPGRAGQRLEGARHPRIATTATLRVPGWPDDLVVTNVHLDATSAARRRRSVEQLVGWLDMSQPQVVLGDLNAEPADEPLAILADAGLRSVLAPDAGGTFHGFTGRTDGARIDHICINDRLTAERARVRHAPDLHPWPSDHWPVVVDLKPATPTS
ncbi:endonuclease/exonuclease/phosphatase family protein [soil metagenome]